MLKPQQTKKTAEIGGHKAKEEEEIHAFSQPNKFSTCARVASILVKNMSTKYSSYLHSIDTQQWTYKDARLCTSPV